MQKYIQALKNILIYKEPKDVEGFELLEDEYEGVERHYVDTPPPQQEDQEGKAQNIKREKNQNTIKPLTVEESNKAKAEKNSRDETADKFVSPYLQANLQKIKKEFKYPVNADVIIREFKITGSYNAAIVYIEGMIDKNIVNDFILRQIMNQDNFKAFNDNCPLDYIANNVAAVNNIHRYTDFEKDIIPRILSGLTALFIDGCTESLLIESKGYVKRSVEKPVTENVVRGPQEGFTEDLRTNITLVRRIIKNKNLVTEIIPVGKTNNSTCAVMYMDGIVQPDLVKEVRRRIKSIDVDFILGEGMLEQFIEDSPFYIFPQLLNTERPDRTVAMLMGGQVAIIVDGMPFASTLPVTFFSLFHTSEDAYAKWEFGTLLRIIRLLGLIFALFLPGLYIALTLYHKEMIPTDLLAAIARARENVPFPTIIEVLVMEISFELIREAGIRIPGVIGTTLGIIGALILGQAAVAANIVSPILIIIVAVTGLGNFALPSYSFATGIRVARFVFIFAGAIAGFYGISAAFFIVAGIACHMKSFGVPFLSPIAPKTNTSPDIIIRQPAWRQEERQDYLNTPDRRKQKKVSRGWTKKKEGRDDKGR